jgi:GNAT superfamily N-acetyltransferase
MLSIRPATPEDIPLILAFIGELAEYERAPEQAVARPEDLLRDGWGPAPKFRVLIADWERQPAGFALFFHNYSTWQGRPALYLEDLFVRLAFRGRGIGKALLVHLAKIAVKENCGRFQWSVLDWNQPSIDFYEALGARKKSEWVIMQVDGEALEKLAKTDLTTKGTKDHKGKAITS